MKAKTWMLGVAILLILVGGAAAASAAGLWQTSNGRSGRTAEGPGALAQDPSAIRGTDTFGSIATTYDVPLDALGKAFLLGDPSGYGSFQCKDLSARFEESGDGAEIGVKSVRYFVSLYTAAGTAQPASLPQSAADILKAHGTLQPDQAALLDQYTVALGE